jgi:hypothetical protein
MKSSPSVHLAQDHVFSQKAIVTISVVVVNVRCTISVQVGFAMTMSIKVRKSSLVIRISTCRQVWRKKRWETSFLNTCSTLQSNSCNDILKCVMGCCMFTPIRASKQMGTKIVNDMTTLTPWKVGNYRMWQTKMVHNVIRKWADDKWNVYVVGRTNNQVLALGPTHEQKHVRVISKITFTKKETNSCSCKWSAKEACN